ncbi:MAG TPA: hypothetical protein VMZ22_09985 [Acidimicrobiales bacterium]|nr:hypothetical protein [Acidimicrobiales bacterium]
MLVACGADKGAALKLDGSPRVPDDEGVATVVTRTRIELDGKRKYQVADDFVSFSTYTGELEPMVGREGQYVQLGLRGRTAVWMAGVAAVVSTPARAVYYLGRLKHVDGERLVFADGTVLRRRRGLRVPRAGSAKLQARIDPKAHRVVELIPA